MSKLLNNIKTIDCIKDMVEEHGISDSIVNFIQADKVLNEVVNFVDDYHCIASLELLSEILSSEISSEQLKEFVKCNLPKSGTDAMWTAFTKWLKDYIEYGAGRFNTMHHMVGHSEQKVPRYSAKQKEVSNAFMNKQLTFKEGPFTAEQMKKHCHALNAAIKVYGFERHDYIIKECPLEQINERLSEIDMKVSLGQEAHLPTMEKTQSSGKSLKALGFGDRFLDFVKEMGHRKYEILDNMEIAEKNKKKFESVKAAIGRAEGEDKKILEQQFALGLQLMEKSAGRLDKFAHFLVDIWEQHEKEVKAVKEPSTESIEISLEDAKYDKAISIMEAVFKSIANKIHEKEFTIDVMAPLKGGISLKMYTNKKPNIKIPSGLAKSFYIFVNTYKKHHPSKKWNIMCITYNDGKLSISVKYDEKYQKEVEKMVSEESMKELVSVENDEKCITSLETINHNLYAQLNTSLESLNNK